MSRLIIPQYNIGIPAAYLGAAAAPSGPAFVQQAVATDASGVPIVAFAPAATNSVIMIISYLSTDGVDTNPRLTGGVSTSLTLASTSTVAGVVTEIWYAHVVGASHTAASFVGVEGTRCSFNVSEWSGLVNEAPERPSDSSALASSTVTAGTDPPSSTSNVVIAAAAWTADNYSSGPTEGYTRMTQTGGGAVFQEGAYLIQATNAEGFTQWTLTAPINWATASAIFGA